MHIIKTSLSSLLVVNSVSLNILCLYPRAMQKLSDIVYNIISSIHISTDWCLVNRREPDSVSSIGVEETEVINLDYGAIWFHFNSKNSRNENKYNKLGCT